MTSEIYSKKKYTVIIMDYFEPFNYSNLYNSQQIIPLKAHSKGVFSLNKLYGQEKRLKRYLIRLKYGSFFLNNSYRMKTLLNTKNLHLSTKYPFSVHSKIRNRYLHNYYRNVPQPLKATVKKLIKNKRLASDVILSIYNWIKNNIELDLHSRRFYLEEIIYSKKANLQGMIDLWVHMLRLSGIPARVVHGYSLASTVSYRYGKKRISCIYPRSYYHWIEVFLEGSGWFPIDPFANTLFFVPTNLIRKSTSSFFRQSQDRIFVYPLKPKDLIFRNNIFSQKEPKEKVLQIRQSINSEDYLFSPIISFSKAPHKKNNFTSSFIPKDLNLYNNPLKINMEVTPRKPLTQKLYFKRGRSISSITIPIYMLERSRIGKIWIEVRKNGKIYKSYPVNPGFQRKQEYRLLKFRFPKSLWLSKKVEITLKIKDLAAVFWYAVIGNPIGDKNDTYQRRDQFLHIDMCYKLH